MIHIFAKLVQDWQTYKVVHNKFIGFIQNQEELALAGTSTYSPCAPLKDRPLFFPVPLTSPPYLMKGIFFYTGMLVKNLGKVLEAEVAMAPPYGMAISISKERLVQRWSLWQYIRFQWQRWQCFNTKRVGLFVKRQLDIVASATVLILLSPLLLIVATLIFLDSPGPIFFSQQRVGKQGKVFTIWKFRSMYMDAEQRKMTLMANNEMKDGVLFKIKNDPRITRVGRFIRKFSIDELPQLWNVLKGDMSLVGPRPPLPNEVAKYSPSQRQRLEITPGITCIWQVSGRNELEFPQQVELDLKYIATQSFIGDLRLLLKTIPAVLKGHGAY